MAIRWFACFCLLSLGPVLAADAQDPVEVEDAQPVDPAPESAEDLAEEFGLPAAEQRLSLKYDEFFSGEPARSLQEEISIDLIDLENLRGVIEGGEGPRAYRLSLEDCIEIALRNNPDIIIAAFEPYKADQDVLSARGEFDPQLSADWQLIDSSQAASQQTAAFGGVTSIESLRRTFNASLAGRIVSGTQYNFSITYNREQSTFGNFVTEFDAFANFTLTQPLLRGFGPKVNLVRVRTAKNAKRITERQLELQVLTTVSEVIKAYWDLVGAIENLRVQRTALANAERLLSNSETRRDIGTAADIEVLQAKAGVATRQGDFISARSAIEDAADRLKLLLDLTEGNYLSEAFIVPTDRPNLEDGDVIDIEKFDESVANSIDAALTNRPEITIADLEIASAELELKRAKNDKLPQLDVFGSYGRGGRNTELERTLTGLTREQDRTFTYGAQASIPLGNRAARGAYEKALLNVRQSERRRHQTREQLVSNVRIAARQTRTNYNLVESNRIARQLQEANVVAEERRFGLGVSTSFQVLQVQEDLTAAQTVEVQARINYEKSLIDLQLAEGTLLDNLGIEYEPPNPDSPVITADDFVPGWE